MDGHKAVKRKRLKEITNYDDKSESDDGNNNLDFVTSTNSNPESHNVNKKKNNGLKKYTSENIASSSKGNTTFEDVGNKLNVESEDTIAKKKKLEKAIRDSYILEKEFNVETSSDHHLKSNPSSLVNNQSNKVDLVKVESEIKKESNGKFLPIRNRHNKGQLNDIKSESFVNDTISQTKQKADPVNNINGSLKFSKIEEGSSEVHVKNSISKEVNEKDKAGSYPELQHRRKKHHRSVTDAEYIVNRIITQQSFGENLCDDDVLDDFKPPRKNKHHHHRNKTEVISTDEQTNTQTDLLVTNVQKIRKYANSSDNKPGETTIASNDTSKNLQGQSKVNKKRSLISATSNRTNKPLNITEVVSKNISEEMLSSDKNIANEKPYKKHKHKHARKHKDEDKARIKYDDYRLENHISQQLLENSILGSDNSSIEERDRKIHNNELEDSSKFNLNPKSQQNKILNFSASLNSDDYEKLVLKNKYADDESNTKDKNMIEKQSTNFVDANKPEKSHFKSKISQERNINKEMIETISDNVLEKIECGNKNEKITVLYGSEDYLKSIQNTRNIEKIVASKVTINIIMGKTSKENKTIEVDNNTITNNKTENKKCVPDITETLKKVDLPKTSDNNEKQESQNEYKLENKNSQMIRENTLYKVLTITYTNEADNKLTKVQYNEVFVNEQELYKYDEITENKNGWTVTLIEEVKWDKSIRSKQTLNNTNKNLNTENNWYITLDENESLEYKNSNITIDLHNLGKEWWGRLKAKLSSVIKNINQKISESKLSLINKTSTKESNKRTKSSNFAESEIYKKKLESKSVQTLHDSETDDYNEFEYENKNKDYERNVNEWWKSLKTNLSNIMSSISTNVEKSQQSLTKVKPEKVSTSKFYKTDEVEKIENYEKSDTTKRSASSLLEKANEFVKPLTEKISSILNISETQTIVKNNTYATNDTSSSSVIKKPSNGILKKTDSANMEKVTESNTNVTFSEKVSTKIISNRSDEWDKKISNEENTKKETKDESYQIVTKDKVDTDVKEKANKTDVKPSTSTIEKLLSSGSYIIEKVKSIVEPNKANNENENFDKTKDFDDELVAAVYRFLNGQENLKTLEDLVLKKNKTLRKSTPNTVDLVDEIKKPNNFNSQKIDNTLGLKGKSVQEKENFNDKCFNNSITDTNKNLESDIIKLYLSNKNATNFKMTCQNESAFIFSPETEHSQPLYNSLKYEDEKRLVDINNDISPLIKSLQNSNYNNFNNAENTNYVDVLRHYTRQKHKEQSKLYQVKVTGCKDKSTNSKPTAHNIKKKYLVSLQTQTEINTINDENFNVKKKNKAVETTKQHQNLKKQNHKITEEEKYKFNRAQQIRFKGKIKNTYCPSNIINKGSKKSVKDEKKIKKFIHENVFSDSIGKRITEGEPLMFSSCSLIREKKYRIEEISEVRKKELQQNKQDINQLMKRLSQLSVKTTHKESWTDCPNLIDCENFLDRIKISLSITDCDSSSSCSF